MFIEFPCFVTCSGAKVGTVHLWLVGVPGDGTSPSTSKELVSHLASLEGHPAPITKLVFCESASLLASGCKAGSIRIWDIAVSPLSCAVGLVFTSHFF